MTDAQDPIKLRLRELERSFTGFERGERNRLYESRDSLVALAEAVEVSGYDTLTPLCEMSGRLLGLLLMEGGLDEARSVQFVRELLGYIESQLQVLRGNGDSPPGGVFHVVNSEKVGEILVRRGLLAPNQLEEALLLQRVSKGKRVGEVLLAMNAIDQRTLSSVLESQKGDTRRAETRRSSVLGQNSIQLTPLPPVPGMSSPSALPAPGPTTGLTPLPQAPVPFSPPAPPGPAPVRMPGSVPPMAEPGQPMASGPAPGDPHQGAPQPGGPGAAYPGQDPAAPIPFPQQPEPDSFPAPPRQDPGSPFDHPEAS